MTCESCGGVVTAEATFCPHCGARQKSGETASEAGGPQRAPSAQKLRPAAARNAGSPANEDELWSGTYSPKAMVGPAVGLGALTIVALAITAILAPPMLIIVGPVALVLWAILGVVLLYRRMTVRYRLTTYRFFHETGLLSRTRNRVEVIDINDVTLSQGLIERMFNVGTIHIQSSDVTHPNLHLVGIENVRDVTDLIDNTRRKERERRGLFMENVGPGVLG
jgi:membrane protein YdbS with pleckstrin-like domain